MRTRSIFLIILGLLGLWFLYVERTILTPFIVAGIFSYVLNPLVRFLSQKLKLNRTLAVTIIYLVLMAIIIAIAFTVSKQVIAEWDDLRSYINGLINQTRSQVSTLPYWGQQAIGDALRSVQKTNYLSGQELFLFFPRALTHVISFVIFIFASFYFLKEGPIFFDRVLHLSPKKHRVDIEILFRRINAVLEGYLRGQLFLIVFVAVLTFIALTILGIRFSLIIAIFSGFAEIVPLIGPITAAVVAVIVALVTGSAHFGLQPFQTALIIAIIYFIIRHVEDYFVTPMVMGKVTKLHPLVILFAVLAGHHLMGILGLIIAVPVAAIIRLLIEFSLDKANQEDHKKAPGNK